MPSDLSLSISDLQRRELAVLAALCNLASPITDGVMLKHRAIAVKCAASPPAAQFGVGKMPVMAGSRAIVIHLGRYWSNCCWYWLHSAFSEKSLR